MYVSKQTLPRFAASLKLLVFEEKLVLKFYVCQNLILKYRHMMKLALAQNVLKNTSPKKKQAEKTVKLYLHFTMSSTFLGCLKERVEPL